MAANDVDDTFNPPRPVSANIKARRTLAREPGYDARWRGFLERGLAMLPQRGDSQFAFPHELDYLGRTSGEHSLIGIVHVDGNGIGAKFSQWIETQAKANVPDDEFIAAYQQLSQAVADRFTRALSEVIERVCANVGSKDDRVGWRVKSSLPNASFGLKRIDDGDHKGDYALPIRPLVLGGDDLTFVCDGRIALDLAATALSAFGGPPLLQFDSPIYASAGVAIIPSHSPFFRGYRLAEDLCNSVKAKLKEQTPEKEANGIDWHLGILGSHVSLASYRERLYSANGNQLTCRPYLMGKAETPGTWQWFSERLLGTDSEGSLRGPVWQAHHSKAKEVADVALEGPEAVNRALYMWQRTTPGLTLPEETRDGFIERRTPLLDAVELLDIYWPLNRPEGRA